MMVHYFNGKEQMAYTLCWKLPFGLLAVRHTAKYKEVTCPTCLKIIGMLKEDSDES